jgi:pSer/pThr/pTyr-binding forkhead associated (FHA) protein
MPYLVFVSPSRLSVEFKSNAKVFRQGYDVLVEADDSVYNVGIDLTVSRRIVGRDAHLIIYVDSGKVYVKDAGSTNGTRINGVKIEPYKSVEISPNDTITIGYYTTARVEYELVEGPERSSKDLLNIAISILINLRKIIYVAVQNIKEGVNEFASLVDGYKDWLEPCKLTPQGICEAFKKTYVIYEVLKTDPFAINNPEIVESFINALKIFDETIEKTLQRHTLRI